MSTDKLKTVSEGVPLPPEPQPSTENARKTEGSDCKVSVPPLFTSPSRIAVEHNYAKLVPFRSSHSTGNKDSSFSTVVLFADRIGSKLAKKKSLKGKKRLKHVKARVVGVEELQSSHGEVSNEEGDLSAVQVLMEVEHR